MKLNNGLRERNVLLRNGADRAAELAKYAWRLFRDLMIVSNRIKRHTKAQEETEPLFGEEPEQNFGNWYEGSAQGSFV